jgi:hypothetical protein
MKMGGLHTKTALIAKSTEESKTIFLRAPNHASTTLHAYVCATVATAVCEHLERVPHIFQLFPKSSSSPSLLTSSLSIVTEIMR